MSRAAPINPTESLATMSEHLGRLLVQADRLLDEWKEHADAMKVRFEAEARIAGETLHRTLEAALAETAAQSSAFLSRQFGGTAERLAENLKRAHEAAEKLGSARGGGGGDFSELARQVAELRESLAATPRRVAGGGTTTKGSREGRLILILALSANLLLVAAIAILLLRRPPAAPSAATPVVTPAAVDAGAAAAPVPPSNPTPAETRVATPCATLAFSGPDAERSLVECLDHMCKRPDGEKPSAPDNCEVVDKEPKKSKKKMLRCTVGADPPRTFMVDLPADCP